MSEITKQDRGDKLCQISHSLEKDIKKILLNYTLKMELENYNNREIFSTLCATLQALFFGLLRTTIDDKEDIKKLVIGAIDIDFDERI